MVAKSTPSGPNSFRPYDRQNKVKDRGDWPDDRLFPRALRCTHKAGLVGGNCINDNPNAH